MPVTSLFAAILAFFGIYLSIQVSRMRWKKRVSLGAHGDSDLRKRMRAFGNFAEYTPLMLILMGLVEMQGFSSWLLISLGVLYIIGRFSHAYAIYRKPSIFRVFGMTATHFVIGMLALLCGSSSLLSLV